MTAPELLREIEGRGGKIAVALDADGAAKIQIAPRGIVGDLAGEIQRFKPALLELLSAGAALDGQRRPKERPSMEHGPQMPVFAGFSPSPDFAAWHWRVCVRFDHLTARAPYQSWEQFARVHCGQPQNGDVAQMARTIYAARRASGGFDFGRLRVAWRVANELTGQNLTSPELSTWAREVLESPKATPGGEASAR